MAHIVSITIRPASIEQRPHDHFARIAVERAALVPGQGIQGDTKGRLKDRELNVMLAETVTELKDDGFRTEPGELGEQLVIAGVEAAKFVPGALLRLGDCAVIQLYGPRTPCSRFAHIQGKAIKDAKGWLGFMAGVVSGGEISVGTAVRL